MDSAAKDQIQARLRALPSVTELLKSEVVSAWLQEHPRRLVAECLKVALAETRQQILSGEPSANEASEDGSKSVVARAADRLEAATTPHLREAINATGILLHTGLGRSVFPGDVVESLTAEMKGYVNLATDRLSGQRINRDAHVEYLLQELTGAEAATVVNNNAGATMLVLAALARNREVIVSRGQLIEIGGSFRLPDVMAQSQAQLVEVGTTNRTHLKDYAEAITENTAAIMRVHPSNYRVTGFTREVALEDLVNLARERDVTFIDDLGAGALVDLGQFGLPHETTVGESIAAGADLALFSSDKLIGASQGGIIVGRRPLIDRVRKHPLMRALRVDKLCLLVLERTLPLFRDADRLRAEHPLYRMISTPVAVLEQRAQRLSEAIASRAKAFEVRVVSTEAYLGSGALPTETMPSVAVRVTAPSGHTSEWARRLRADDACVFGRIEDDALVLDVRTITDDQVSTIAAAFERIHR